MKLIGKQRIALFALGTVGLLMLILIRGLTPDPRGFGTHEQLGLTPCFFHSKTGIVCPTCGMTTAWAHALQGNLSEAAATNLGGTLLCGLMIIMVPWSLLSVASGNWLLWKPTPYQLLIVGSVWLAIVILDWATRLVLK